MKKKSKLETELASDDIEVQTQALELEWFIRKYTPKFWKETIETVCFVPIVLKDDYINIVSGKTPERFDKWYFKEAIRAFFEQKEKSEDIFDRCERVGMIDNDGELRDVNGEQVGLIPQYHYFNDDPNCGGGMDAWDDDRNPEHK
jgi:hypothetical protein